jgi:(p)ppGpp synthase/HD superfamily hydrolase
MRDNQLLTTVISVPSNNLLALAISTAAHAHRHQVDHGGEAYILHPLRVMSAVKKAGYDYIHQIAAVFHDILEDTYATAQREALTERFGYPVMTAVDHLTRRFEHVYPEPQLDEYGARKWGKPLETYQEYFGRCVQNPVARVVKYYDLLDNADPRRFRVTVPIGRYVKGLLWYKEHGLA